MTQYTALFISLIVETPVVVLLLRKLSCLNWFWLFVLACGATMLTHPFAWETNTALIPYLPFSFRSILIEFFVIFAEGVIFWLVLKLQWQQGLIVSFIANILSFLLGLYIYQR